MWLSDAFFSPAFLLFSAALAFFHKSEFLLAAVYQRDDLSWTSWLITRQYSIAMACAVLEYAIEATLAPALKRCWTVSVAGLALVVVGEALRKAAMLTAKQSFTHNIKFHRRPEHTLVTHGVYAYVRHPAYLGWLMWAVGTQVLLINPLSACAFALVSWRFFRRRIPVEEQALRELFEGYAAYAARVPSGVPFVR